MYAMREHPLDVDTDLLAAVEAACARIAPTWPLDRFVAVNPWWGHTEAPIALADARLRALAASRIVMPREYFRSVWDSGRIPLPDLEHVLAERDDGLTPADAIGWLEAAETQRAPLPLATHLLDRCRDVNRAPAWQAFVLQQVSQYCAARFDEGQATLRPSLAGGLYAEWREVAARDAGMRLLMGRSRLAKRFARLPGDARALIAAATAALALPPASLADYFTALLLNVNGWAAWCAFRRWEARLAGQDDDCLIELLAIRLAWEWVLHEDHSAQDLAGQMRQAWATAAQRVEWECREARLAWIWQAALERGIQRELCARLKPGRVEARPPARVLAVFCIDVRSEVMRRALEDVTPEVQTAGFAGFFGLGAEYSPLGSSLARPHLPALLAPQLKVRDRHDAPAESWRLARRRQRTLRFGQVWDAFQKGAASAFSFVETLGAGFAGALLGASVARSAHACAADHAGLDAAGHAALRPRLTGEFQLERKRDLAAGILRAMSLTADFPRVVMLCGHGSQSANNAHASGLDCGACGGQTGEVSARATAALLNEPAIRAALGQCGISIPDETVFIAGLHNTTTDEIALFDRDLVPATHVEDVACLRRWLAEAGHRARRERAPALGMEPAGTPSALLRAYHRRANDWAEVRPEWGLAGCAALIVAPRTRTRAHLGGRCFLHEYRWKEDTDFRTLELVMTAPMVVAHWIAMQYHASTVDPVRYGSGDKVLHNVVGGHVGVFEGNGGDLRIGLPLQSVHDGARFRHEPVRLSVFIEAPQFPIDEYLRRHAQVGNLVRHGWIHLFRIDSETGFAYRWCAGQWNAVDGTR